MTTDFVAFDSETCGLFGPIALFQYGEGFDGPITLYSPMKKPIEETIDLYKWLSTKRILGFNLAFDVFKVQQQLTTLMLLAKRVGKHELPINHIDAYALCEPEARDGPCWKPLGAMDLMLHARKGPWQNLMARDPIIVRRVPRGIAPLVMRELEARINLPDIFFAKRKPKPGEAPGKWRLKDIKTAEGVNPDFVNIELDFNPSSALKALATHELNLDPAKTLLYAQVEVDRRFLPEEQGVAPFALSVGRPGRWNGAWPDVIEIHSNHWEYNQLAREYATKDIVYPRALYDKWGRPPFDDNDSILACLAGSTRWKGFSVNLPGLGKLKATAQKKMKLAPRSPSEVVTYLKEKLDPIEQVVLQDKWTGSLTTKKIVLEEIRKLKSCQLCLDNIEHESPKDCVLKQHQAAERANLVLGSRQGKKEEEIYEKLELAKRFHVSVNVIGARSSRQSGGQVTEGKKIKKSGGLNPQGIQKKKAVREQFPLAFTDDIMKQLSENMHAEYKDYWDPLVEQYAKVGRSLSQRGIHIQEWAELGYPIQGEKLVGGDFDKFEVCIADAYYLDPQLRVDLTAVEPPCERELCKYSNPKCATCKCDHHSDKPCDTKGCGCVESIKVYVPRCSACTGKPSKPGSVKIHAIIGALAYVGRTYWEIRATDGKDLDELKVLFPDWPVEHWVDLYTRAKSAFFALIYFGNEDTLASRLGIPKEDGLRVFNLIMERYPVMSQKRLAFYESFCPVRQPDGGQVFWVDPDDYGESMNGFKRFVTLENKIIRALYDLAEDVPPEWYEIKARVIRRKDGRAQSVAGAVKSALYGAAFGLQEANKRAMGNHVIQSTGAIMTKELQSRIWRFQPSGISPWIVRPMNVHDELPTAIHPDLEEKVAKTQFDYLAEGRNLIPLLAMKWKPLGTWGGK